MKCPWATNDRLTAYHDNEWGIPLHDERRLFEMLILEGVQAGLSWDTVLRKRDRYREVFDGFDPEKIARYDARKVRQLLTDPGIIRNRAKVAAAIGNARAFLTLQEELRRQRLSFDAYLWSFVGGKPICLRPQTLKDIPVTTPESHALSKALLTRGFKFVGPTICYAFMQAVGMTNDHLVTCFRAAPERSEKKPSQ